MSDLSDSAQGKRCTGCKRTLPAECFAADRNRRDGLQVRCRECVAEYSAAHYRRRRQAIGKPVRERMDVPHGHKLCRTCGEIKPHSEWPQFDRIGRLVDAVQGVPGHPGTTGSPEAPLRHDRSRA
ncbi:hypothetical protein GCM10017557_66770 [Streptomyces aurantiacus]|uniref:Recombination endonuclease VII n=1 Tax=Streptomyces aurantiacus TaxID=47760 RepID=A0A7G1P8V3_9ACTN|nr:hypothetical protein GCM10017557_66770 [Streptomyces aurantiacus]